MSEPAQPKSISDAFQNHSIYGDGVRDAIFTTNQAALGQAGIIAAGDRARKAYAWSQFEKLKSAPNPEHGFGFAAGAPDAGEPDPYVLAAPAGAPALDAWRQASGVQDRDLFELESVKNKLAAGAALDEKERARLTARATELQSASKDPSGAALPPSMVGMAKLDPAKIDPAAAAFPQNPSVYDAAFVVGGVNGTWHSQEKWLPDIQNQLKADSKDSLYAFEGLRGAGNSPHNSDYVWDNARAIALDIQNAVEQKLAGGDYSPEKPLRFMMQTYSMGGIVGPRAVKMLENEGFFKKHPEVRADIFEIQPPSCGFTASNGAETLPRAFQDAVFTLIGHKESPSMGPNGAVISSLRQGFSSGAVQVHIAQTLGDDVSTARTDPAGDTQRANLEILSGAQTVKVGVGSHNIGNDPAHFKNQGLNIYAPESQISAPAAAGLAYAENLGLDNNAYPQAARAGIVGLDSPLARAAVSPSLLAALSALPQGALPQGEALAALANPGKASAILQEELGQAQTKAAPAEASSPALQDSDALLAGISLKVDPDKFKAWRAARSPIASAAAEAAPSKPAL